MFETSVVREGAMRSRSRFSLLTISIVAHSAVIVGVVAASVMNTEFPAVAPDEVMNAPQIFSVSIPPPLGNPNGGGALPRPAVTPPPVQRPPQQQLTAPPPDAAPDTIPNDVPTLDAPSNGDAAAGPGDGLVPGPIGVPWGDPNSPGSLDAPPSTTIAPAPEPQKIYTVGEVAAPVLLERVEPAYPPALVRVKLPGKAIVRCVIDKNGRVRDPQIVYASMPPFGEVTVRALERWRYKPASLNGTAVECYLDVVVDFSIK
jgi:TonB family protein